MEIKVGYIIDRGLRAPLVFKLEEYVHILVCGKSGSGKTVAVMILLNSIFVDNTITVYIGDPKNSGDFEGMANYYAADEAVINLIEEVYQEYKTIKEKRTGGKILIIIDEYPAFITNLENQDKKKAARIKAIISTLLMQGRSLPNNGFVGVWLIAQRPDAEFFPKGARLNFLAVMALGGLDAQIKTMLFSGENLPEYQAAKGTGVISMDGKPIRVFRVPMVKKAELKELLQEKARRRNGNIAGSKPG